MCSIQMNLPIGLNQAEYDEAKSKLFYMLPSAKDWDVENIHVWVLVCYYGYTQSECAETMGCGQSTVSKRVKMLKKRR